MLSLSARSQIEISITSRNFQFLIKYLHANPIQGEGEREGGIRVLVVFKIVYGTKTEKKNKIEKTITSYT